MDYLPLIVISIVFTAFVKVTAQFVNREQSRNHKKEIYVPSYREFDYIKNRPLYKKIIDSIKEIRHIYKLFSV